MLSKFDSSPADLGELGAESMMFFLCAMIFGCQAIGVAGTLTWRNRRGGLWLNGLVLGAVDVTFLFVMVFPGHADLVGGLVGPVIWAVATGFSLAARPR